MFSLILWPVRHTLPGVLDEPRKGVALAVGYWKFERNHSLTIRQRLPWRYNIDTRDKGEDYEIVFEPVFPNRFTNEDTERRREAWETHVFVSRQSFRVTRWYLAPD
jgi:hypothetical protein